MPESTPPTLYPTDWVARARRGTRQAFVRDHGATPILLFSVVDPDGDLVQALIAVVQAGGALVNASSSYATQVMPILERMAHRRRRPFSLDELVQRFRTESFVVLPLRKRSRSVKPFAERISVGRARNNDIVLRDPSVSKFHAWFECDDNDTFYLVDAGSTNTTVLNGTMVDREPQGVQEGDAIRFGAIDVVVVRAETLWDALHAA